MDIYLDSHAREAIDVGCRVRPQFYTSLASRLTCEIVKTPIDGRRVRSGKSALNEVL